MPIVQAGPSPRANLVCYPWRLAAPPGNKQVFKLTDINKCALRCSSCPFFIFSGSASKASCLIYSSGGADAIALLASQQGADAIGSGGLLINSTLCIYTPLLPTNLLAGKCPPASPWPMHRILNMIDISECCCTCTDSAPPPPLATFVAGIPGVPFKLQAVAGGPGGDLCLAQVYPSPSWAPAGGQVLPTLEAACGWASALWTFGADRSVLHVSSGLPLTVSAGRSAVQLGGQGGAEASWRALPGGFLQHNQSGLCVTQGQGQGSSLQLGACPGGTSSQLAATPLQAFIFDFDTAGEASYRSSMT